MENSLSKYESYFSKLRVDKSRGTPAPHKPILLLSIIELIEKGTIADERIFITGELILTFRELWKQLVGERRKHNFSLPYYHLSSEPFWRLVPKPRKSIELTKSKSIKSFKSLKDTVAFAELDHELFQLLTNEESRIYLKSLLLRKYFSISTVRINYKDQLEESYIQQLVSDDLITYKRRIYDLSASLNRDEFEQEIFVRSSLFQKEVPKVYDYHCCISGLKISPKTKIQMVDACHIIPFSEFPDDRITNGLCLTPTLHRAFDNGLFVITDDYVVKLNEKVDDSVSSYSVQQFHGTSILLPKSPELNPSLESLAWHRKKFGKRK